MTGVEIALAAAAVAATASAGYGTYASVEAANAQEQVAKQEAKQRQQAAAFEEAKLRRESARLQSRQQAAFAASGVTLDGSPLALLEDTVVNAELDALATRYGGQVGAYGANVRRKAAQAAGQGALIVGGLKTGASLLNGASQVSWGGTTITGGVGNDYGSADGAAVGNDRFGG